MHPEQVEQLLVTMNESAARFTRRETGRDLDRTLREVVAGAVAAIPGVSHAGITALNAEGRFTSTAPSGEVVARLDQAQAALREGPCVSALAIQANTAPAGPGPTARDGNGAGDGGGANGAPSRAVPGSMVRVDDMSTETDDGRWPRFAPEALRNGIVSMLSLHLSGDRWPMRALNLYADQPDVFDTATCVTAALFADQAAIAVYGAQQAADLDQAVATRDVIGQAKGILLERHRLAGSDDAFRMLVEASQHTNVKLRDIADWLISETTAGAAAQNRDR